MEEETEDEHFTLTSFEPLSPERKKSGFSRFIEGFTSRKFLNLNESDDSREHGDQYPLGVHNKQNGTQLNCKGKNFEPKAKPGLLREDPKRNNDGTWKGNSQRKLGLRESSKVLTKTGVAVDRNTRTPSSVLRRLSLLISVERTAQQPSQSSSNLKKYWMPDEQCKVCYECGVKFNTFRRRHHCRLCGQIFCSQCCNEELSGHQIGYTGVLRVCVYCKKIVLAYTSSSDIDKNLKQLKQDLSLVGQQDSPGTSDGRTSSLDDPELNRSFDVLGVSAQEANLLKQDSLKQLWQQITAPKTGLELQSHRIRLRTYSNCLVGRELVDWLFIHRKVPNRSQAFQVCQGLQDSGWIEPLVNTRETVFKDDFVFYVPGPSASGDGSFVSPRSPLHADFVHPPPVSARFDDFFLKRKYKESLRNDAGSSLSANHDERITGFRRPGFVKNNSTSNLQNYTESFVVQFQNKSLPCEDLFLKVDTIKNEKNKNETTELPASMDTQSPVLNHFVYVDDWYLSKSRASAKQENNASKNVEKDDKNVDTVKKEDLSMAQKESDEVAALEQLSSIHRRHISSFLAQLLDRIGLSQSWKDVVEPLSLKVCEMVIPDVLKNDDMDIRQYVKIKKIPGGEKSDCRIVSGVVCTKNVVHKKMATTITEPKILMLSCPVDFQRVENKLTSLDPVVLQEEEFLKNYVGRIAALSPTIVLVEKTVTRLAQDMLLARGVSVMLNVKPKLMTRISRCTEGDVLPSLDQGSRPNLGTCRNFKIEKYVFKNGSTKTLAYFEGCSPQLGSTIVIRGGNVRELSKVKHVLRFMTFVAYNSKLEKFFIMDEFGTPFKSENEEEKGERRESDEGGQSKGVKDGETQGEGRESDEGGQSKGAKDGETQGERRESDEGGQSKGAKDGETQGERRESDEGGQSKGAKDGDTQGERRESDEGGQSKGVKDGETQGERRESDEGGQSKEAKDGETQGERRESDEGGQSKGAKDGETQGERRESDEGGQSKGVKDGETQGERRESDEGGQSKGVKDGETQGERREGDEGGQSKGAKDGETQGERRDSDEGGQSKGAKDGEIQGERRDSDEGGQSKGAKDGETKGESKNERSFWKKKQNKCVDDEFQVTLDMEGEEFRKGRDKEHEDGNEKMPNKEGEVVKGNRDGASVKGKLHLEVFNERSMTGNCDSSKGRNVVVNGESFQKVMSDVILCSSPLISFPVPYILTLEGQRCELLSYMEEDLYWSPLFNDVLPPMADSPEEEFLDDVIEPGNRNVFMKEAHPFVFAVLAKNANDLAAQTLLAHYRAKGGRITVRRELDFSVLKQKNGVSQNHRRTTGVMDSDSVLFGKDFIDGPTEEECQITSPLMRDCFDPFLHQMIAILFSSYSTKSANVPHPCIRPWTVFMEFYGKNDIALGCFLERYCFRSSYLCPNPNCDVPMVKHVRYFAHGNGAVYINMKNLEAPIPGFSKTLLTWSWCKQCKQVTPVVPVSPEAWRLSFAKYLELRMYGTCYKRRATVSPCDHSLHQDHYQYFAFNNIVASLKYVPVKIYEVFLPPTIITLIEEERQPQFWIQHIQAMSVRVYKLVDSINERIAMLKTEPFISNCVTEIGHDQGQLHEKIKVLERKAMLLLHPPPSPGEKADCNKWLEPHEMSTLEYEILDGLTLLKRMMCEYREKWNAQLSELVQLENEKKKNKSMDGKNTVSSPASNQSLIDESLYSNWYASSVSQSEIFVKSSSMSDNQDITKNTQRTPPFSDSSTSSAPLTVVENESSSSTESEAKVEALNETRFSNDSEKKFQRHSELWATLSREVHSTLKDTQLPDADKPGSKVKRTIRQLLPGVTFNPIRPPFPPHEHHLLPSSEIIPVVVNEKEPTSIIAYTLSTIDYQKKLHKIQDSMMTVESDRESFTCVDLDTDGVCRLSSIIESEDNLGRNRTRSEVETMSSASLLTNLDDFVDNYFECFDHESDDEETSSQNEAKNVSPPNMEPNEDKSLGNNPDIRNGPTLSETKDDVTTDGLEKEQPGSFNSPEQEVEYHIRHSFSDSTAKFFCVIYFGEQFRRIRKTFFPDGEEKYIRSVQYCLEWRAKGGKSGSSFCKTKDDRFVIKEMSRSEAQSFLDIAPYYFEHIGKSVKEKRPTLLAKILGVYRIGCTNKVTNTLIRKDLLIMDNLLYNCKADKVFDLKGSIRSRYVMSSEENNVLLDENLLEMIVESPLFIRPHSKAVLSRAINQDTEFLAKHMVMDYSLLLGIEQDSSKLVVGIIDFIRTFTWDKKLEMYVKSTGILGGQGKMPTVVSPKLYRERFCEAMQRYFLMIPNKWMGLGNELK